MPSTTLNGLRHYFRLEGRAGADPLVLVHALGTDHSLWDAVVARLTETHQVLRHDLRGHGGTDTGTQAVTVDALAQDLLALADHAGWRRFRICGLSIGALVAVAAASQAPERVSALVLASASPRIPEPPGGWAARAQAAVDKGMKALAPPMMERMFSPAYRQAGPALLHTLQTVFEATDPRGYAACVGALDAADLSGRLAQVACPTLVVRGAQDVLISAQAAGLLAEGIAGARFVEVEGGHFPPAENPEGFVNAIQAH